MKSKKTTAKVNRPVYQLSRQLMKSVLFAVAYCFSMVQNHVCKILHLSNKGLRVNRKDSKVVLGEIEKYRMRMCGTLTEGKKEYVSFKRGTECCEGEHFVTAPYETPRNFFLRLGAFDLRYIFV